jgi:hypothetical protein
MVFIECPKQGIVLLLGFGRAICNTFLMRSQPS